MKRCFAVFFAIILCAVPAAALAQASGIEQVGEFDVQIYVNGDASIDVRETILYDFGPYSRHGIFRDIPVKQGLGNLRVTDEKGNEYVFETTRSGDVRRIKIGDPDTFIEGTRTYVISYRVLRAVGFFEDFDEIYWNATGNDWNVPIKKSTVSVSIPGKPVQSSCYAGPAGSTARCNFSAEAPGSERSTVIMNHGPLGPKEGLTVAVAFPKGLVVKPPFSLAAGLWVFILPLLILIWRYRKWSREGRDPKGTGVIVAQYEAPDGLSPMQIKFLSSYGFGNSIAAEIIYLATKGYLKIRKVESGGFFKKEDYELIKLKEAGSDLGSHEQLLLERLFSQPAVRLSDLKDEFYEDASDVEGQVEASLVQSGHFPVGHKPLTKSYRSGRRVSHTVSVLMSAFFMGVVLVIWVAPYVYGTFGEETGLMAVLALVLSILIWAGFAIIMPRLTPKGVVAKEHIEGFKLYLSVAEKDRINFHNAPAKNPETFEKFLPYAMVLDVEKEWGKVFEGLTMPAPSWYADSSHAAFNAGLLVGHVSSFAAMSESTLSHVPGGNGIGSGGGGFSGGGGGGGGGGSW